jgi:hypothetical protein
MNQKQKEMNFPSQSLEKTKFKFCHPSLILGVTIFQVETGFTFPNNALE